MPPKILSPSFNKVNFGQVAAGTPETVAYTNFIARTSGLNSTYQNAYKDLFYTLTNNGLFESGGTSTRLDYLYIFCTADTTTAKLNLVNSPAYNLTYSGTPPEASQFAVNVGYHGDGSTVSLDTNFPQTTGGIQTGIQSDSFATFGVLCPVDTTTGDDARYIIQAAGPRPPNLCLNFVGTGQVRCGLCAQGGSIINDISGLVASSWALNVNSTDGGLYRNGVLYASCGAGATLNDQHNNMILGSPGFPPATDTISCHWAGAVTATQIAIMDTSVRTFMTAVGGTPP